MSFDHSAPLRGVVICCTSIPDEKRTTIASYAEQMGATHQLDLTRDVTHLIIGSCDTPKYRYIAKNRQDIMPMTEAWIEAIRDLWIADREIDLESMQQKYLLPTFHSLRFSMTGCEEPAERLGIAELVKKHGATYEGDLTRSITHLISLRTDGAKYRAAISWGIKIVSIEWLYQSLERGMILEEKLFDPTLPKEERGKGAWNKTSRANISIHKRLKLENTSGFDNKKRKLRRAASTKLCNQHDRIWADISGGNAVTKNHCMVDVEVKERYHQNEKDTTTSIIKISTPVPLSENQIKSGKTGVFTGCRFWLYGFPGPKIEILQDYLMSNQGEILHKTGASYLLPKLPSDNLSPSRQYLVVPHDLPKAMIPVLPESASIEVVTVWWIERCLHHKQLLEPKEHIIGRPFPIFPIPDIVNKKMTFCSSSFNGVDLLHLVRAIELIGATYNDFMTPNASILIAKSLNTVRKDKMKYAVEWKIPVVVANWLWDSIEAGTSLPTHAYEIQRTIMSETFVTTKESLIPLAESIGTTSNASTNLSLNADQTTVPNLSTRPQPQRSNKENVSVFMENSKINSFRSPSKSSKLHEKPANNLNNKELSELNIKQLANKITTADLPSENLVHPTEDITNAISTLIARSKSTANNQSSERMETRKRSRILGRVTSNASNRSRATSVDSTATQGHAVQWPSNNSEQTANERIEMLMSGGRTSMTDSNANQLPSTQLEYDDPDSTIAREVIMARMRGEVVDIEKVKKMNEKETTGFLDSSNLKIPRSRKRGRASNS